VCGSVEVTLVVAPPAVSIAWFHWLKSPVEKLADQMRSDAGVVVVSVVVAVDVVEVVVVEFAVVVVEVVEFVDEEVSLEVLVGADEGPPSVMEVVVARREEVEEVEVVEAEDASGGVVDAVELVENLDAEKVVAVAAAVKVE